MRRRSGVFVGAAVAALLVPFTRPGSVEAQNRVGRVENIASLGAGARPIRVRTVTDLVELARGSADYVAIGPDQMLYDADRLRLRRYVDMRLRVERPRHDGRLTFLAEVLDDDGNRVFTVEDVPERASYRFATDTTAAGELGVVIESGALVVDWQAGRLRVTAAGHATLITETRVVFTTDAAGTAGFLYVEEGSVVFPATPGFVLRAGQVARLQAGVAPGLVETPPARLASYRGAGRYNADRIWAQFTPFWRKPAFLLPAVGVVAGAVAYVATRSSGENGPDRVRVIIRIPF